MAQQNADFAQRFTVLEADGVTPFSLTGWALRLDVKNAPGATPIASYTTGNGGLVVEAPPNTNSFDWISSATQNAAIPAGMLWFDIVATEGSFTQGLGGGWWIMNTGISNSPTLSLPFYGYQVSNTDVILMLSPRSPPNTGIITNTFLPVAEPLPPASGNTVFCDIADQALKIIGSNGTVAALGYQ